MSENWTPPSPLVLSGHANAGKTTLAHGVARELSYTVLSTRDLIARLIDDEKPARSELIKRGDELDHRQGTAWIIDGILQAMGAGTAVCLDRIRKPQQLADLRKQFGRELVHVHVMADRSVLRTRYRQRLSRNAEDVAFEEVLDDDETFIAQLHARADLSVNTAVLGKEEALSTVVNYLCRSKP